MILFDLPLPIYLLAISLFASTNCGSGGGQHDAADRSDASQTAGTDGGGGGGPNDFPASSIFYQDISNAAVDSESATVMAALQTIGWGDGSKNKLGIDVSFAVLTADSTVPRRAVTQSASALPDCDTGPVPLAPGGRIEGHSDYFCSDNADCHLLVYQSSRLYEVYQASVTGGMATGGAFTGSCIVIWDLTHDYWAAGIPYSRGDGCNGADAADFPIAPMLLKPAEVAAGSVNHAMRFTISNNRIRAAVYVHPATHLGGPSGGSDTLPYGSRLRLKSSFDLSKLPSDAARTVARALQKYGMFLADGGNIYISATDDLTSAIAPSALNSLQPSDFEMIDGGTRYNFHNQNCIRTPISN